MKQLIILILVITTIGGIMRLTFLDKTPPSVNWDEAALGYNAYSLLKSGQDEYRVAFPIFSRSFDEYKSALPMYLMTPAIQLFGLSATTTRGPIAIMGTLTIPLLMLMTYRLTKSQWATLFAGLSLALAPWSIHLSRVYQEATVGLFFLLLSLLMFIHSRRHSGRLFGSLFFALCAMFSYNAEKIVIPLYLFCLVFLFRKRFSHLSNRLKLSLVGLLVIGWGVFGLLTLSGQAFARAGSTDIFRIWTQDTQVLPLKTITFIFQLLGRYLAYFSPTNLFVLEPVEPATAVVGNSLFHPIEFIFWLLGLVILFLNHRRYRLPLILLISSPLPPMLTWNWFSAGRALSLFLIFSFCVGLGARQIYSHLTRPVRFISLLAIFTLYLFSTIYLSDSLLVQLPYRDSGNWQPGFKETVPTVYELSKQYDQVIIETPQAQPYIFYLFYSAYPPSQYHRELDLAAIGIPRKLYDFGKFHFRKIYWPADRELKRTLFVGNDFNLPPSDIASTPHAHVLQQIMGLDGYIAAKLVATD